MAAFGRSRQRSPGHPAAASFGQQLTPRRRPSRTHFGRSAPARRGCCCTSGERDADGVPGADGPNRKSNRTSMVQVEHRNHRRPITSPVPAGRVAQRNAYRPAPAGWPTPKGPFCGIFGGGGYPFLGISGSRTLTPRTSASHGRLLDIKYFLPKRRCPRVVRAQKFTEKYRFSGIGCVWEVSSACARKRPCGQLWHRKCPEYHVIHGTPRPPPPATRPVHQGNAMPTVYPARSVQTARVIGRRRSRWSIGAIGVR